jgi:hypothetical protein
MHIKLRLLCLAILLLTGAAVEAQREVNGQVNDDENKAPLQGVNVTVKNSRVGTATDADGKFRLAIPADAKTLACRRDCLRAMPVVHEGAIAPRMVRSDPEELVQVERGRA